MTIISPGTRLKFSVSGTPFAALLNAFADAISRVSLPAVTRFETPAGKRSKGFDTWRKSVESTGKDWVLFGMGSLHTARVNVTEDGQHLEASLGCSVEHDLKQLPNVLGRCADIVRTLSREFQLDDLMLLRDGEPGFKCTPITPAMRRDSHAAAITTAEIAAEYESESAFLTAWPQKEQTGKQWLLFRGLDSVANTDFLRVLIDSQWALARAAKPGRTGYTDPIVEDHEQDVYHSGEPTLHPVAHIAAGNIVEVVCSPPPGEFVRGWEVYNLRHILQTGALDDGRRVDTLRVMFLDQETAERNKRPLLDIGARVAFPDAEGEPAYVAA